MPVVPDKELVAITFCQLTVEQWQHASDYSDTTPAGVTIDQDGLLKLCATRVTGRNLGSLELVSGPHRVAWAACMALTGLLVWSL